MNGGSLSVVIPALNEEHNLESTIDTVLGALRHCVPDHEIIIVDDGSGDGTGRLADALAARHSVVRVVHNDRTRGLGYSYFRGVAAVTKDHVVFVPGDNGWPYESLAALFDRLGTADVVTSYAVNPEIRPKSRQLLSRAYTAVLNRLFGHRLRYYNGLTIYPVDFLRSHPGGTAGFAFMAEALLRALAHGLSCAEVALRISERASGRSKALRLRNIVSVIQTIGRLYWELRLARAPSARRRAVV